MEKPTSQLKLKNSTHDPRQRVRSSAWNLAYVCLLLAAALFQGRALLPALRTNFASTQALQELKASPGQDLDVAAPTDAVAGGGCLAYLELDAQLRKLRRQDPARALRLLQETEICGGAGRRALLIPMEGELLTAVGRYSESCQVLSSINAKPMVLDQAEYAYQHGNWDALAFYVDCVEKLQTQPGRVSAWTLSEHYLRLGGHYQSVGQLDQALEAYTRSYELYPGVYARPIEAKAMILQQQNKQSEAIETLLSGLVRHPDKVNAYVLMVDLAHAWKAEGKIEEAYCMYEGAQKFIPALPAGMDPEGAQAGLIAAINSLPQAQLPSINSCAKVLATYVPGEQW